MKNYIKHPAVYVGVPTLLVAIALLVFTINGSENDQPTESNEENIVTELNVNPEGMLPVQLFYEDGVYNAKGTIKLPDPCYDINTDVVVKESYPEQVDIMIKTDRRDEVCESVITEKDFNVEFEASENAQIQAVLDGEKIDIIEMSKGL